VNDSLLSLDLTDNLVNNVGPDWTSFLGDLINLRKFDGLTANKVNEDSNPSPSFQMDDRRIPVHWIDEF
jgi:hypothetical protein